jgi:lysophospholipase L1-like esterase
MTDHHVPLARVTSRALCGCAVHMMLACGSAGNSPASPPSAETPIGNQVAAGAAVNQPPSVPNAGAPEAVASPSGAAGTAAGSRSPAAGSGQVAAAGAPAAAVAGASATSGGAGASASGAAGAATASAAGTSAAPVGGADAAGGATATAGAGGAAAPPAIDWSKREDLGKGDGKDVVTIGDSWMAGPVGAAGIQAGLDRAGTSYRHYAVTATTLLSGQIPGQYDQAKSANAKISTVIMTGGGNDVMFTVGACSTAEACENFSKMIVAGLDKLWTKMADDGVKDVVYVQYADSAGTTPQENRSKTPPIVPICTTGRIYCHSIPTSDIISAADLADGIHPGTAGNDRIAKRVLQLMEEHKMRR